MMGKNPHGREKMRGDYFKRKTKVERETEFSWDLIFKIRCYSPNV